MASFKTAGRTFLRSFLRAIRKSSKNSDGWSLLVHLSPMLVNQSYTLTIDELSQEVARLLKEHDLSESLDNRVSPTPDMRTIRYYSSLGLIDRPAIVGRVAKYSRRHLLQILAIKMLQKHSRPLSEIQEALYGLSDAELEAVIEASLVPAQAAAFRKKKESPRPVYWREIVIAPGLKIMADQSWSGIDRSTLEDKIWAAIEALEASAPSANGE